MSFNPLIQVFDFNFLLKEHDMKRIKVCFNPLIQVFDFNVSTTSVVFLT